LNTPPFGSSSRSLPLEDSTCPFSRRLACSMDAVRAPTPAIPYGCPSLPGGTRTLALETSRDLPSLSPGATANVDVMVRGARRRDFADASRDTGSIAFVLDCHDGATTACA